MKDAAARTTDPGTSHEAARVMNESGAAKTIENIVAEAIRVAGMTGLTWDEIHERTQIDKASISPRLAPLRRKGIIKDSGGTRNGQSVWIPGDGIAIAEPIKATEEIATERERIWAEVERRFNNSTLLHCLKKCIFPR